jgi:hypothetical protein
MDMLSKRLRKVRFYSETLRQMYPSTFWEGRKNLRHIAVCATLFLQHRYADLQSQLSVIIGAD